MPNPKPREKSEALQGSCVTQYKDHDKNTHPKTKLQASVGAVLWRTQT